MSTRITRMSIREILCVFVLIRDYKEYSCEFFLWDLLKNEGWSTRSTHSHIFQNV